MRKGECISKKLIGFGEFRIVVGVDYGRFSLRCCNFFLIFFFVSPGPC